MKWFSLTLRPNDAAAEGEALDEICSELMERGALGTSIDTPPEITCYLQGDEAVAKSFAQHLPSIGCSLVSLAEVSEDNWTGACPDVWEPIHAGSLLVVPVESDTDPRPVPEGAIKIIPGLGFGTGHHATTKMVLEEITHLPPHTADADLKILDLGTGSGILAIAAAKLFGAPVEAIDIDEGAIENARDNAALNHVSDLIALSTTPLEEVTGVYDLILANVYGEVLSQLASEVTRVAKPAATLIVSGITELVWNQVFDAYCEKLGWDLTSERAENGWVCAVLHRVPSCA
jgi:ribosomal protein L11 methyltransferase